MSDGRTHWEGCWRDRAHHACAVAEVERLQRENARLRVLAQQIMAQLTQLAASIAEPPKGREGA